MTADTTTQPILTDAQMWVLEEIQRLAQATYHKLNKVRREAEAAMERMDKGQNASYTMDADVTGRSSLDAVEANAQLLQVVNTASMLNVPQAFIQGAYKAGIEKGRSAAHWS